ncbi:serine-repeat antigen protein 6-like isoform X2 [Ruditapes philippinarum]|uniref:serine-repeat antigen protein 6-like isoform X2 n=1 Tax=Ruditapes philippinarum TaxID=129788 RepID=UPI00295B07F6|nr:serine-repeat antigen protein 6-like isoform X2 [Ruditapes philippinarum]
MSYRPKVADPTELQCVFTKYKSCLRTIQKPPKWKKKGVGDTGDCLSKEEEKQKKDFKCTFVMGVQTVMRNLEKDNLSMVLLWKDMQPAVLRKALCHLLNEHGCPAMCVSDLLVPIQKSWPGLTSATSLGVLKTEVPNDFHELIEIVRKHAPPLTKLQGKQDKAVNKPLIQPTNIANSRKINDKDLGTEMKLDTVFVHTENEKSGSNLEHLSVGAAKFYIYKPETKERKSFCGQDFIAFDDRAEGKSPSVETLKGVRMQTKRMYIPSENQINFGIRPTLVDSDKDKNMDKENITDKSDVRKEDFKTNDRKRKASENDNETNRKYKKINVKKFQKNTQKKKKSKKK